MAHDLLSPSASHTWLACPGAPVLWQELPDETSEFAEEGSRAHEQAERAVTNTFGTGANRVDLEGDDEMIESACGWVDALQEHVGERARDASFWQVEYPVSIETVTGREGAAGTVDFFALLNDGTLFVADFKYGRGVKVEVERNPQLMIYAAAIYEALSGFESISGVRLMIYQPRVSDLPSVWSCSVDELKAFAQKVGTVANQIKFWMKADMSEVIDRALVPGEAQCRFCKARATCPALRRMVAQETKAEFDILPDETAELPMPETADQLSRALRWLPVIERWTKAVNEFAVAKLERGESVPGFKLVAGRRGPRKWIDGIEDKVAHMRISANVIYEKKIISPTKAEKFVKTGAIGKRQWKKLEEFITRSDGRPVLASSNDERPALSPIKDDFKNLEVSNA